MKSTKIDKRQTLISKILYQDKKVVVTFTNINVIRINLTMLNSFKEKNHIKLINQTITLKISHQGIPVLEHLKCLMKGHLNINTNQTVWSKNMSMSLSLKMKIK